MGKVLYLRKGETHTKPTKYLNKGQLITMNLGNGSKQYRVLKMIGTVAEVLAMYEYSTDQFFNDSPVLNNKYFNSNLDNVLDINFYSTLSENAKKAIVPKTITQYKYIFSNAVLTDTHASYADYSTKTVVGTPHDTKIYALDIEDIEEYFGGVFSKSDLWTLFWNTPSAPSVLTYPWLRSAVTGTSDNWYVSGSSGYTYNYIYNGSGCAARPSFQIDLTKVSWEVS